MIDQDLAVSLAVDATPRENSQVNLGPYWEWADPDGTEAFVEPGGLVDVALHELGGAVYAVEIVKPDEC